MDNFFFTSSSSFILYIHMVGPRCVMYRILLNARFICERERKSFRMCNVRVAWIGFVVFLRFFFFKFFFMVSFMRSNHIHFRRIEMPVRQLNIYMPLLYISVVEWTVSWNGNVMLHLLHYRSFFFLCTFSSHFVFAEMEFNFNSIRENCS